MGQQHAALVLNFGNIPAASSASARAGNGSPQGRYNGGQKASYLLFMGMIAALAVTGWLLWLGAPVTGKLVYFLTFYFHVWGSIIISILVVCAHIPLALLSMSHFKGIWRLGPARSRWKPPSITLRSGSA
ncbi:MAG: cytochrome b/b6 domain-containing protein [Sutterella wadsworthensis]